MNRADLIAAELHQAVTYEREAKRRERRYPKLAARLRSFAQASRSRAEEMRCGPLFGADETQPDRSDRA